MPWLFSVETVAQVCFFICCFDTFFSLLVYLVVTLPCLEDTTCLIVEENTPYGAPYSPAVSASLLKYPKYRRTFIGAMPNNHESLE